MIVLAASLLAAASVSVAAADAVVQVTSGADSGPGTLRSAILAAEPGTVIELGVDVTLVQQLDIATSLTIRSADGQRHSIAPAAGTATRLIHVSAAAGDVTLERLILRDGRAVGARGWEGSSPTRGGGGGGMGRGGAILSETTGTLVVRDVGFIGNTAQGGSGGTGLWDPRLFSSGDAGENGEGGAYAGSGGAVDTYQYWTCVIEIPGSPWPWDIYQCGEGLLHTQQIDGPGGGGAGLGGAIHVAAGTLEITGGRFEGNAAHGGTAGSRDLFYEGADPLSLVDLDFADSCDTEYEWTCWNLIRDRSEATAGQGKGGAVYVAPGAVARVSDAIVQGNVAADAQNGTCPGWDTPDFCGDVRTGQFVAGDASACRVGEDGRLVCWGDDAAGIVSAAAARPELFAQVSIGDDRMCGVTTRGALACWGEGAAAAPSAGHFASVAVGADFACALRYDGTIACWGSDAAGQVSGGPGGTHVALVAGSEHACALEADGSPVCWGGSGGAGAPVGHLEMLAAGTRHTCGIAADGTPVCWGIAASGSLEAPSVTIGRIDAGGDHSCAVGPDGMLVCWGADAHGQVSGPSASTDAMAGVLTGNGFTCGVRAGGSLACWGANDKGQAPRVTLATASLAVPLIAKPYQQTLDAEAHLVDGAAPVTAEPSLQVVSGALPDGLSLGGVGCESDAICGTPSHAGTYPFTIRAFHSQSIGGVPFVVDAIRAYVLTVTNAPPVAVDDLVTTNEDTPTTIGVTANDSDPDENLAAASVTVGPAHGSATATGLEIRYAPQADWHGTDVLSYRVCDSDGLCDDGTATIEVVSVEDAPQAAGDAYVVQQDVLLAIDAAAGVLANDRDGDGDAITAVLDSGPSHGTLALLADGSFTYTPSSGFHGPDTFSYHASDGHHAAWTSATVQLRVNAPPVATGDSFVAIQGGTLRENVLANDSDTDADPLTAVIESGPAHGSLTLSANGTFVYAPEPAFHATDTFSYRARDADHVSIPAIVTIRVNAPPVAGNDSYSVVESSRDCWSWVRDWPRFPAASGLLANDTDADGDALTAWRQWMTQETAHGILALEPNGSFRYCPDAGYQGLDSFQYQASDGSHRSTPATVTIKVDAVPVATDDAYSVAKGTTFTTGAGHDLELAYGGAGSGDGALQNPWGIAVDATGATYVADGTANRIVKFAPGGTFERAWGTIGSGPGELTGPRGVAVGVDGTVYVVDRGNQRIQSFSPDGTYLTGWATAAGGTPFVPLDVAVSRDGDVYVTGPESNIVARFAADGSFLGQWTADLDWNQGGIAVDASGFVYVTGVSLQKFTATGELVATWASYAWPRDVAVDAAGNVYLVDYARMSRYTSTGVLLGEWAVGTVRSLAVDLAERVYVTAPTPEVRRYLPAGVLGNDTDGDGDILAATLARGPSHGTLALDTDGSFTYTPSVGYSGPDTFTYVAGDGVAGSRVATVTITVGLFNVLPVATDGAVTTDEDAVVGVEIQASDADGDTLALEVLAGPSSGTLSGTGSMRTYAPNADFHGQDSLTFRASDGHGVSNQATVTITVASINDPPVAVDDAALTPEDTPVTVDVLGNDHDVDGDALSLSIVSPPAHGTASVIDHDIRYVPEAQFSGVIQLEYAVSDGNGGSDTAIASITVGEVNDPPVAVSSSVETETGVPVTVDMAASDPEGDPLVFRVVGPPAHGTLAWTADGPTYVPDAGFEGTDQLTYRAYQDLRGLSIGYGFACSLTADSTLSCWGEVGNPAWYSWNHPLPTGTFIAGETGTFHWCGIRPGGGLECWHFYAAGGAENPPAGTFLSVSAGRDYSCAIRSDHTVACWGDGPSAPAGQFLQVTTGAQFGCGIRLDGTLACWAADTASPILTPPAGQFRQVAVTSAGPPSKGACALATDHTVTCWGRTGYYSVPTAPTGLFESISEGQRFACGVRLDGTGACFGWDPARSDYNEYGEFNVPPGQYIRVTAGWHSACGLKTDGTVTCWGRQLVDYANQPSDPPGGVSWLDGRHVSDEATITIHVGGTTQPPTNQPPVAQDLDVATAEDTPAGVALQATDPDGDPVSYAILTGPAHGTLSGTAPDLTYTPDPNFNGADSFTYRASDAEAPSAAATVTIAVSAVNDAPVAVPQVVPAAEDTPTEVLLSAADVDGDALAFAVLSGPAHGTLAGTPPALAYTPDPDYWGLDEIVFVASDGTVDSNEAVTIAVRPVNDAPEAATESYDTPEDQALSVGAPGVLGNDADRDQDTLTGALVSAPAWGALTLHPDGSFEFVPPPDITGETSFTYVASDGQLDSPLVTVILTISAINDPPAAQAIEVSLDEDGQGEIELLGSDVEGDGLAFTIVSQPVHGTLGGTPPLLTYTPDPDWHGLDGFTYTVGDGVATSAPALVRLTVGPVNDAPRAGADQYSIDEDHPLAAEAPGLLANDTDTEGQALSATVLAAPAHGLLVLDPDGSFDYTPAADYAGEDAFAYRVTDALGGSDFATVTIEVWPVNDRPMPSTDATATDEDTSIVVAVLGNDTDPDGDDLRVTALHTEGTVGTVELLPDGTVRYDPAGAFDALPSGQPASDAFGYTVTDGLLAARGTATVAITGVNDPPAVSVDVAEQSVDYGAEIAPVSVRAVDVDSIVLEMTASPLGDLDAVADPCTPAAGGTSCSWTLSGRVTASSGPDPYTVSFEVTDGAGATATASTEVTVTPATLTVTAQGSSRTYGAANPPFGTTITGFVNDEVLETSGVSGTPTCTTEATPDSDVGSYAITCRGGSLTAENYEFTFVAGALTIVPAQLEVRASGTIAYGAPASFAISGTFYGSDAFIVPPSCSSPYRQGDPVGNYGIECSGGTASGNYATPFTYLPGTLAVAQATTSVVYGGPSYVLGAVERATTVVPTAAVVPGACSTRLTFTITPLDSGTVLEGTSFDMYPGLYEVMAHVAGDANCSEAVDDGILAVASPSDATNGGGWYRVDASGPGSPRVNVGHTVQATTRTDKATGSVTTTYRGQLLWMNNGQWRLKGSVAGEIVVSSTGEVTGTAPYGTFPCPGVFTDTLPAGFTGAACGTLTGLGVLQAWDAQTLQWVDSAYGTVTFTATMYDGGQIQVCKMTGKKKTCTTADNEDWFGIEFDAVPANAIRESAPRPLSGGSIKVK